MVFFFRVLSYIDDLLMATASGGGGSDWGQYEGVREEKRLLWRDCALRDVRKGCLRGWIYTYQTFGLFQGLDFTANHSDRREAGQCAGPGC